MKKRTINKIAAYIMVATVLIVIKSAFTPIAVKADTFPTVLASKLVTTTREAEDGFSLAEYLTIKPRVGYTYQISDVCDKDKGKWIKVTAVHTYKDLDLIVFSITHYELDGYVVETGEYREHVRFLGLCPVRRN